MSEVKETGDEVLESLTGHDEAAIAEYFGHNVSWIIDQDELMLARALIFISKFRGGMNQDDAYRACMDVTFKGLNTYFATEKADEGDEVEESGKGEPDDEQPPVTLLPSVS